MSVSTHSVCLLLSLAGWLAAYVCRQAAAALCRQLPDHGVCLATACLPVCKDAGVESQQAVLHCRSADNCTGTAPKTQQLPASSTHGNRLFGWKVSCSPLRMCPYSKGSGISS
jgi:hypothetical protein